MNQDELIQKIDALIRRVEVLEADNEALRKAAGLAKSADGRVVRMSDGAVIAAENGVWAFDSKGNLAINEKHIKAASMAEAAINHEIAARAKQW